MFPPLYRLIDYLSHTLYGSVGSNTGHHFSRITPEELSNRSVIGINREGFIKWTIIEINLGLRGVGPIPTLKDRISYFLTRRKVPLPAFAIYNPYSGDIQIWYELEHPIKRTKTNGLSKIFYDDVYSRLCAAVGGKINTIQSIGWCPWWCELTLVELLDKTYTLKELKMDNRPARIIKSNFNLNEFYFNAARAYGQETILETFPTLFDLDYYKHSLMDYMALLNPPDSLESVGNINFPELAEYIASWLIGTYYPHMAAFKQRQAARGRLKGQARRDLYLDKVLELYNDGVSTRKIAAFVGVPKSTVSDWIKASNHVD